MMSGRNENSNAGHKKNIFIYSFAAQFENLGDELINESLLNYLSKRGEVIAIEGGAPSWYVENILEGVGGGVSSITIVRSKLALLLALFTSLWSGQVWLVTSCGDITTAKNSLSDVVARLLLGSIGVRVTAIGVSASQSSWSKISLFRGLGSVRGLVGARDRKTCELFSARGVPTKPIPDLAFGLKFSPADRKSANALISLRQVEDKEDELSLIEHLINGVSQLGLKPAFSAQVDRDIEFNRVLADRVNAEFREVISNPRGRKLRQLQMYDRYSFVFSNRLHVLLLAAARGCVVIPCLSSEEKKVRSLFCDLGLHDTIYELGDDRDQDRLNNAIESASRKDWQLIFADQSEHLEQFFLSSF